MHALNIPQMVLPGAREWLVDAVLIATVMAVVTWARFSRLGWNEPGGRLRAGLVLVDIGMVFLFGWAATWFAAPEFALKIWYSWPPLVILSLILAGMAVKIQGGFLDRLGWWWWIFPVSLAAALVFAAYTWRWMHGG